MIESAYIVYAIIAVTVLLSIKAFKDIYFKERCLFYVDQILRFKQWDRLISSGFIHADEMHLAFNMLTLYFFGEFVIDGYSAYGGPEGLGTLAFVFIYLAALVGGNLLALLLHKNQPYYRALGASGAVSGILLLGVMMAPFGEIRLFFAIPMPTWSFGMLYIGISIYGAKNSLGNIGHSAHLGGAIIGLLSAPLVIPEMVNQYAILYFILLIPCVIFLFIEAGIHKILALGGNPFKKKSLKERHHRYDDYHPKLDKEKELNELLDKVAENGINALTPQEKKRLDELSK